MLDDTTGIRYKVIDLETTVRDPNHSFKGNPVWPDNQIVMSGIKYRDHVALFTFYDTSIKSKHTPLDTEVFRALVEGWDNDKRTLNFLVGHNIGFDLHYLRYTGFDITRECPNVIIWDTAIVHHMILGQEPKFPSLDQVCEYYGLPVKPTDIKEFWSNGGQTEDYDVVKLQEYLAHDLDVTEKIFISQIRYLTQGVSPSKEQINSFKLIIDNMRSRLFTLELEYRGIQVDLVTLKNQRVKLQGEIKIRKAGCRRIMERLFNGRINIAENPELLELTPRNLSLVLFGGEYKTTRVLPVWDDNGEPQVYKTGAKRGEPKTKKQVVPVTIPPFGPKDLGIAGPIMTSFSVETKSPGVYSTSEQVLTEINDSITTSSTKSSKLLHIKQLTSMVLGVRALEKDLGTYYKAIERYQINGRVHCSFNHTATATGRLSSSKPNLQNLTHE